MNHLSKLFSLCFVLSLIGNSVISQPEWAPIGARWTLEERFAFAGSIGFIEVTVIGDTTINGQSCRILERTTQSCNLRPLQEFMYEDQDKIYFYDTRNDDFNLKFDFGVEADSSYVMYRMNPLNRDALEAVVIAVDSISFYPLTNGDSLRVQHISSIVSDFNELADFVIQNVGFDTGLAPTQDALCDGNHERLLRCYEDSNLGQLSFVNVDCQFTNTRDRTDQAEQVIELSPIPATTTLNVKVLKDYPVDIEIFDSQGRILMNRKNVFARIELPIAKLTAGLYFIRVLNNKGQVEQIKRWIKW